MLFVYRVVGVYTSQAAGPGIYSTSSMLLKFDYQR